MAAVSRQPGFLFILFSLLLSILGVGLVIPVLPKLVTEMSGGSPSHAAFIYGTLVASYAAMQFLFSPLVGALSDRFGRRPVLLVSVAGSAVDYLFLALAPHLWMLFVGRVVAGMCAATLATANAYVADITPPEGRAKRYGLMGAVFGLGFIIGPLLGGVLGEIHIRAPFWTAAGLAAAGFVYGLLVLPESLPRERRAPVRWQKANPLGAVLALRRFKGVLPLAAVLTLLNLATFSLHAVWVLYTDYRFGWTPRDVGWSLAFVGVMAALVQGGLAGRVVKAVGERATLLLGLLASATAFVLYGIVPAGWMLYPAIVVGAVGGLVAPASQSLITRSVSRDQQGLAQGALTSLGALCYVLAPLLATTLFGLFSGERAIRELPGMPFFVGSLLALVALVIAWRVVRPGLPATAAPAAAPNAATAAVEHATPATK